MKFEVEKLDLHPSTNTVNSTGSVSNQQPTSSTVSPSAPTPQPNITICTQLLSDPRSAQPSAWDQGLRFISSKYEHDPPGFRSNWYHFLKKGTRPAFNKLMLDIINATLLSSSDSTAHEQSSWGVSPAPFWWMLVHLEMLILAPIKIDELTCRETILQRIRLFRQGQIGKLFNHAMQASSWTSPNDRPPRDENRAAQEAADNDSWRQAVSRATNPNAIATIGPNNINTVNNLYTEPHPPLNLPPPPIPQQQYKLPGNISKSIRQSFKRKGKGSNTDSIDAFIDLAKSGDPSTNAALQQLFELIFQNRVPRDVARYFTDTYLFCLHKDPTDHSKLRPIGIPSAMRRIIASHLAKYYRSRFAHHLLPFNLAVGVKGGMDFAIKATALQVERYIQQPQTRGELPSRVAIFIDLKNMFNLISREKLMSIIAERFPEMLQIAQLFYGDSGRVNLRWDDGSWKSLDMEEGVNQGCPLSFIFAAFILNEILVPLDKIMQARTAARERTCGPGDDGYGGRTHQMGFVDNLGSSVILEDCLFYLQKFDELAKPFGCFMNKCKTRILTSCNGQSILPLLEESQPNVAADL